MEDMLSTQHNILVNQNKWVVLTSKDDISEKHDTDTLNTRSTDFF